MEKLLNKLILGTVQFGLDYGINNPNGKPAKARALSMLSFAYDSGIRIFDTAHSYGNSEEILGEFLHKKGIRKEIEIITKCENPFKDPEESLKRLRTNYIDALLCHSPDCIRDTLFINKMSNLKKMGVVKNIGASIYDPEDAIYAAKLDSIDYIQVPYSIFDQRLDKTDFFKLAKKNKKKVFSRSVFLQGLILMEKEKVPEHLKKAKNYLNTLDKIIKKYDLSRKQAALFFALSNKGVDYVVVGVDNINQLKELIFMCSQKIDFKDCFLELKNNFDNVEKKIISPNLWKKTSV